MPGERVTLSEIAKATGYTVNTVSRALRNQSDISVATRKKIQEVARRMGYVPNMLARGLKTRFYPEIAVVLPSLSNPFYTSVIV